MINKKVALGGTRKKKEKSTDHRRPLVKQAELAVLGLAVRRVAEYSAFFGLFLRLRILR